MNVLNRILKLSLIVFIGNSGSAILSIVTTFLLTHFLSLRDFGIIVLVQTYSTVIQQVFGIQSWQSLVKYGSIQLEAKQQSNYLKILQVGFFLDVLGAILAFFASILFIFFLGKIFSIPQNEYLLVYIYSIGILFRLTSFPFASLRLANNYKQLNYYQILLALLKLLSVSALCFLSEIDKFSVIIGFVICESLAFLYLFYVSVQNLNMPNPWNLFFNFNGLFLFTKRNLKLIRYSINTSLSASVIGITRQIDELLIGALLNLESVGIYKIIKILSTSINKIIDPLYIVIFPEFNKLIAKKMTRSIQMILSKLTLYSFIVAGCIFLTIIFGKTYLLDLFLNSKQPLAYIALPIYFIGISVRMIFFYAHPLALAYELDREVFVINCIDSIIYMILCYNLTLQSGFLGSAIAFCFSSVFAIAARMLVLQLKTKIFTLKIKDYA